MDPAILLIIVFIVAPLIERLLKAGKGAQQPPDQPPQQRMPQQRPPQPFPNREAQRRQESGTATAEDDAAAAMLPDDLWEILTGERRPAQLPEAQQELEDLERAYAADEYPGEADTLEEVASLEEPSPGEWISQRPEEAPVVVSHDTYRRPLPEREAPQIVSLEKLSFDTEKRHDRFHDNLDTLGGPERVRRPKPNPYRFTSDEDLRRAIVMNEILGTPKGLE